MAAWINLHSEHIWLEFWPVMPTRKYLWIAWSLGELLSYNIFYSSHWVSIDIRTPLFIIKFGWHGGSRPIEWNLPYKEYYWSVSKSVGVQEVLKELGYEEVR